MRLCPVVLMRPKKYLAAKRTLMEKEQPSETRQVMAEVNRFYRTSFPGIFYTVFFKPVKGVLGLFENPSGDRFRNGLILMVSTTLMYIFIPMLLLQWMDGNTSHLSFSVYFKMGMLVGTLLLLLSIFSFVIKVVHGRADLMAEFFTGGLCGIPLMLLMLLLTVLALLGKLSIYSVLTGNLFGSGIMMTAVVVYLLMFILNILQQSFRAGGVGEARAWYAAPLLLIFSYWLSSQIFF